MSFVLRPTVFLVNKAVYGYLRTSFVTVYVQVRLDFGKSPTVRIHNHSLNTTLNQSKFNVSTSDPLLPSFDICITWDIDLFN